MKIHQHIETSLGEIWIANALDNSFIKLEAESRQEYEARFLLEMLQEITGGTELSHESNGAPVLVNYPDLHISISHSNEWFAVYLSENQAVGVDLEVHSNGIEKTKEYFLSKSEIEDLHPTIEELKICWGIKESIFKKFRGNMKSMSEDITIVSIEKKEAEAKCQNETIKLRYQQPEYFTLVFTD